MEGERKLYPLTKTAVLIKYSGVLVMDFTLILLYSKSKTNKSTILFLLNFDCMPIPFGFSNPFQIINSIDHQ